VIALAVMGLIVVCVCGLLAWLFSMEEPEDAASN